MDIEAEEFHSWVGQNYFGVRYRSPTGQCTAKKSNSALTIQSLRLETRIDPNVGIAFLYCNYKEKRAQNPEDLLASICAQLMKKKQSPSKTVESMYHELKKLNSRPSLANIVMALKAECQRYKMVFVVLDALDECQEDEGVTKILLSSLEKLPGHVRTVITCRNHAIDPTLLQNEFYIDIKAQDDDVRLYWNTQIMHLPHCLQKDPPLREFVITTISKKVDGV